MFLVSGIPRSGTTVIAGFLSLDENLFCYATETHLLPFLHHHFEHLPCNNERIDQVLAELRRHLESSLIEAPRASIERGYGHRGYALIKEKHVNFIISELELCFKQHLYGVQLYKQGLAILDNVLSEISVRTHKGEKTPDNLLPISAYSEQVPVTNFIVVREPFGTIRSMDTRIHYNHPHSEVFQGTIEHKIGIYLRYAELASTTLQTNNSHWVKFEDFALQPRQTVNNLYRVFGLHPSMDILDLAENANNQQIADRAPMKYRKPLRLITDTDHFSANDAWKISTLTRQVRDQLGYSDEHLGTLGFALPDQWPGKPIENALIAMNGFYPPEPVHSTTQINNDLVGRWSTGQSRLIAYFSQCKPATLSIEILTNYPQALAGDGPVTLKIHVNATEKDVADIRPGLGHQWIQFTLNNEDILTVGNGGYAIIDLSASRTFCPLIDSDISNDIRRLAFQVLNCSISN